MNQARSDKDFYVYGARFQAVAAGIAQTSTINIEADSDFVLVKMALFGDLAGAVQTDSTRVIPLGTLQLLDTGSGRNLFSTPIPVDSIFGNGQLPFVLPIPREFKAKASIQLTFTNFSAATTYTNVWASLIGYKQFYY